MKAKAYWAAAYMGCRVRGSSPLNLPFPHLITNCWMCFYEYLEIVLLILRKDKLFSVKKCVQDDYKILGLPRA